MTFYSTMGYTYKLPPSVAPSGTILLCGALPMHQLQRRQPKPPKASKKPKPLKHPHMARAIFDPQLYLASLDANQTATQCVKLATYPWFGIASQLASYDSREQRQNEWMKAALQRIGSLWPGKVPTEPGAIQFGIQECVDLQIRLGCEVIVLPAPLTHDPSTTFHDEIHWLDAGVGYARAVTQLPIYATVALADLCLRYAAPEANTLLELVADTIGARGVQGVYLVVEQASEPQDTRQCGNARVLASALHLTHLFAHDCGMAVAVNFFGAFGLACQAAGARLWSSHWYKSLHRLRLADQGAPGRAYPSYWTSRGAFDVNLDADFDAVVAAGALPAIADSTAAAANLLAAASRGVSSQQVGAWAYRQSNVATCIEHYLQSATAADTALMTLPEGQRVEAVEQWLVNATAVAQQAMNATGPDAKTKAKHVAAWLQAFRDYRRIHAV
jgi:hypothetical protein